MNPAALPILGSLLLELLRWWREPRTAPPSPDGDPETPKETASRKIREPSTHIGAAEIVAALTVFNVGQSEAETWAALVLAVLGVVNMLRREKPHVPAPPAGPQP